MVRKHLLFLTLLFFLIIPAIAVPQTVSFTQTSLWTCPSDVNMISNLVVVGSGAGGVGGYAWTTSPPSSSTYGIGTGPGGANGTYLTASNIPVIPGQSYLITIGSPGSGAAGIVFAGLSTYTHTGNSGQSSSAFGYTASGGPAGSITCTLSSGQCTISISHTPVGGNGYGNYQIATSGGAGLSGYDLSTGLVTSYGSIGGVGYGAGGGGGAAGAAHYQVPPSGVGGTTGNGGNGAYGYVEFTYDSASTQIIPTGYVIDASTSSVISGATISATQNGVVQSVTSASSGSFSISNTSFTVGVPMTIVTTKSGYGSDTNTFTPLVSGPINLTIPLIPFSYYTNTTIVGITRDNLYGNPLPSVMYYAQDTMTTDTYSNISNANGFAMISSLNPSHFYFVWANKTGYTSPSPVLVKPYS